LYLHCEVLFVRDQKHPELLHPRISIYQAHSFNELYEDQKQVLMGIYNDYFFRRHTQFWRESAMRKLPTLINSTGMLCCGEDLGMVPACVPDVMHELQILSLEIQRMPKDPTIPFAHPADAPYLSVCTTGTHDTNPLRAWWEEDRAVTQRFYNEQMGWWGEAPQEMSPEIAEFIVNQHMYSPAMWVILPLQDWLAIDGDVRLPNQFGERINVPANPKHFWNYRMHLTIEDLLKKDAFNEHVRRLTSVR
jgi:4-alpha-glucanotransferase